MARATLAQPDVTLILDTGGVIREATVSSVLSQESVDSWLGCAWRDTVADFVSDKVLRIVEDARDSGISAFRQLTQRFPSGREVPMEYTTVLLGGRAGLLAVGKSLLAVAELQSRFVAAQQTMERDHWKLRDVETRYRLLFNHSSEAVLLLRADDFSLAEANPAALRVLAWNGSSSGGNLMAAVPAEERGPLRALLHRALEQGRPPALLVRFGEDRQPWMVRASVVTAGPEPLLLVQLVPTATRTALPAADDLPSPDAALNGLVDGFVLIDQGGVVRRANQAFADLVDMVSPTAVIGQSLDRWMARPGADLRALLSTLRVHQVARLFPSSLRSDLESETEVEISGTVLPQANRSFYGLLIRDVGRRLSRSREPEHVNALIESVAEPVGKLPLRQLIRSTVDGVERHYVKAALDLVGGNRTAAAEVLGLSRQSLYTKLGRYGLETETQTGLTTEE